MPTLPNLLPATPDAPASSLVSLGMRPQIMTGCFRQLIIQHFSDPSNVEAPSLRGIVWTPDITSTQLIIEAAGVWKPDTVGQTPRIIVSRGPWQSEKIGLNSLVTRDYMTGDAVHSKKLLGSHIVSVTTPTKDATDILAWEVYAELLEYGPILRQNLNLLSLDVQSIGAASDQLRLDREESTADITITYTLEHAWTLSQEASRLKTLDFQPLV